MLIPWPSWKNSQSRPEIVLSFNKVHMHLIVQHLQHVISEVWLNPLVTPTFEALATVIHDPNLCKQIADLPK